MLFLLHMCMPSSFRSPGAASAAPLPPGHPHHHQQDRGLQLRRCFPGAAAADPAAGQGAGQACRGAGAVLLLPRAVSSVDVWSAAQLFPLACTALPFEYPALLVASLLLPQCRVELAKIDVLVVPTSAYNYTIQEIQVGWWCR